jgi:hypothetical protein
LKRCIWRSRRRVGRWEFSAAPILDQDIEHHAVLVHRAPEVMQYAVDPQVYLVEMPGVARL